MNVLSSIMPRAPRIQIAGGIYKVGSRGNGRRTLFHDAVAYQLFLELLGASVVRFGWLCHTYCLMPNHFHLLIETTEANISAGTQWLKGRYAQWFNKRNGKPGTCSKADSTESSSRATNTSSNWCGTS